MPDAHPRIFPENSSRRRSRSASGLRRLRSRRADQERGRREEAAPGLTTAERDELARLRRENKQLRLERDILSKAAAWFARETGAVPSGSSGS